MPLFVAAAAVVVNVGAMGSHAMIVSRELGIPCVVSVQDATGRIPDGAMVTVDGNAGTVTVRRARHGLRFARPSLAAPRRWRFPRRQRGRSATAEPMAGA